MRFFPALQGVPPRGSAVPVLQTEMECHGIRADGEVFLARVGSRPMRLPRDRAFAAVVFDASDDLRDREECSLQQLLSGSRILVGAVCHEMRDMCGAISVVQARLARTPEFAGNDDLRALGRLVEGLGRMAGLELRQARRLAQSVDLAQPCSKKCGSCIEPGLREDYIAVGWDAPRTLPRVWADRPGRFRFPEFAKNSQRGWKTFP